MYLGLPLKPNYKTNDFNFVLDKLSRKLQGLKSNLLSKAGRTQLITSTLTNISNHIMNVFLLPKCLSNKIDSLYRNLRKSIGWEKTTRQKNDGGLGISLTSHQNKTQILKLIWNLNSSPNKLWTKIMKSKYSHNVIQRTTSKSMTLRNMQKLMPTYLDCTKKHHW